MVQHVKKAYNVVPVKLVNPFPIAPMLSDVLISMRWKDHDDYGIVELGMDCTDGGYIDPKLFTDNQMDFGRMERHAWDSVNWSVESYGTLVLSK